MLRIKFLTFGFLIVGFVGLSVGIIRSDFFDDWDFGRGYYYEHFQTWFNEHANQIADSCTPMKPDEMFNLWQNNRTDLILSSGDPSKYGPACAITEPSKGSSSSRPSKGSSSSGHSKGSSSSGRSKGSSSSRPSKGSSSSGPSKGSSSSGRSKGSSSSGPSKGSSSSGRSKGSSSSGPSKGSSSSGHRKGSKSGSRHA